MRAVTLGLLLVCAASWGGCGNEASERVSTPGSTAAPLRGPEGGRAPAAPSEVAAADAALTPVGRALAAWVRARPLHLALTLTHAVQERDRIWTGSVEDWRNQTTPTPAPLQIEGWAGDGERAALSSEAGAALSYFAAGGAPWLALGSRGSGGGWIRYGAGPRLRVGEEPFGWYAEAPPSTDRLGAALEILLDPVSLQAWLARVRAWSTATDGAGTAYHAMARGVSAGLGREVDVRVVLGDHDAVLRLEVDVRYDRNPRTVLTLPEGPDVPPEVRPGKGVWGLPFPLPPLLLPDDVLGPSKAKGDPTLGDVAHERTTFVLRPDPNPPTPAFEKFLATQRTRR